MNTKTQAIEALNEVVLTAVREGGEINEHVITDHALNLAKAALASLRAQPSTEEVDIEEVRKAFNFIKEKVAYAPVTQTLTDIDKWANHGLASLPTLP